MSTTLQFSIHFERGQRGRRQIAAAPTPPPPPPTCSGRVPRVSRLMALAIRFDRLIAERALADYAQIAQLGHVTRARMSQIMSLLMLAPDIQEALLHLPPVQEGRDPITERQIRPVMKNPDWRKQRHLFSKLMAGVSTATPIGQ